MPWCGETGYNGTRKGRRLFSHYSRGAAVEDGLEILYEDNHCLAVLKPAGALSAHYEGKEQTLDRAAKAYLKAKYNKPGNVFMGVVHRLDRPVSRLS